MSATVTIRREILDAEVHGTETDGLALQRRLSDVCADVLGPALGAAFARVDPGDAHVMIERLAIDLGDISMDRLDEELTEAVHREVADFFRRNPVPSSPGVASEAGEVQRRNPEETVDEALLVFLRTGRLPWSFRIPPGSRLEQVVLDAWAGAEHGPPPELRSRLPEVLAHPSVRTRLITQFSPAFVMTLLRRLAPALAATLEEIEPALAAISSLSRAGASFRNKVWDNALVAASTGRRPEPRQLARSAWLGLSPIARADPDLAAAIERRWPGVTERHDASPVPDAVEAPSHPMPSPRPVDLADEPGGILVDNAGVVLVHPFLPRFLEGLGLATVDDLVEPDRAVCLLHHLATGEMTAPEHQLTVAKILCGVRLDDPTEADVGITEAEIEEAVALLDAAVGHWGALGDSAPDALRGEFLMRPGTLAHAEGDWLLRVEARTVDILLDQLPWSLSLVKLPWMDRPLRVEWR